MVSFLAQDVVLYVNEKRVSFRDLHKSPYLLWLISIILPKSNLMMHRIQRFINGHIQRGYQVFGTIGIEQLEHWTTRGKSIFGNVFYTLIFAYKGNRC